jgi:hypothetical protein
VPEKTNKELIAILEEAWIEVPKNARKADLEALVKELENRAKAPVVPEDEDTEEWEEDVDTEEEDEEEVEIPITGVVGDEVEENLAEKA